MSLARAVQFKTPAQVLEGYENRKVPAFAIFCGKQFLFCENPDDLEDGYEKLEGYLALLKKSESSAIYSLMVYEDMGDGQKIKSNTPYDGSFNFQFRENIGQYGIERYGQDREILSVLEAIKLKQEELEARLDGQGDAEEDGIGKILNHPIVAQLPAIIESLPGILAVIQGIFKSPGQGQLRALQDDASIPASSKISGIVFKDPGTLNDDEKIAEAVRILKEKTKDFPALLYKIAMLSVKNPIQYGIYMAALRAMRV